MSSIDPIVIIGSGLAGYTFAREYRKLERNAPLVIITGDDGGFYSKPSLSNAFAAKKTAQQLVLKSGPAMQQELGATILSGAAIRRIDTNRRVVTGPNGELAYSKLVLALGADPIRLPLEGDGAGNVLSVNDINDYARFRAAVGGKGRVAVLGAGLIGCEFANDLLAGGFEVDVIDIAPQPLGRLLPPEPAGALRDALEAAGVRWHLGRSTKSVQRNGPAYTVTLDDGSGFDTDAVLSAVGLQPRTELAKAAGLMVNRGIVVDAFLRSSNPDVYALGDCAEVDGAVLPYVMPIMHCARALAWSFHKKDHAVKYPAMPVVVKTPALPTVVCPPAPGAEGRWHIRNLPDGIMARFMGKERRLLGFALTGGAGSQRQALLKEMQPV